MFPNHFETLPFPLQHDGILNAVQCSNILTRWLEDPCAKLYHSSQPHVFYSSRAQASMPIVYGLHELVHNNSVTVEGILVAPARPNWVGSRLVYCKVRPT